MSEADDFVGSHVATDHAVRQPLLKRLIDDAATIGEVAAAARQEFCERNGFRLTAASCFQYGHEIGGL